MILKVYRTFKGESSDGSGETHRYIVETDDAAAHTCTEMRSATDGTTTIPADNAELFAGSALRVTSKTAKRFDEGYDCFEVIVTFARPDDSDGGTPPEGGGKWNVTVESEGISFTEPVTKTRQGTPIENTANQPFDPTLAKEYYDELFNVQYTTDFLDADAIADARGKINSDTVTLTIKGHTRVFDPGTLKLGNAGYGITLGDDANEYWRVHLPLMYRKDDWKRRVPDMGYYELVGTDLVAIKDSEGKAIVQPAYLDGSGAKLTAGSNAVLLAFDIDDEIAFAPMLAGI